MSAPAAAPRKQPHAGHACGALGFAFLLFLVSGTAGVLAKLDILPMLIFAQLSLLGAAALVVYTFRLDTKAMRLKAPTLGGFWAAVVGGAALTTALAHLLPVEQRLFDALGWNFEPDIREFQRQLQAMQKQSVVLMMIVATTVPAVCEEALFRFVALSGFVGSFGRVRGLVYTTLLFSGIHQLMPQVVMVFFVGLYIGAVVLLTDSVWTGVSVHLVNNAIALTVKEPSGTNWFLVAAALAVTAASLAAAWRLSRRSRATEAAPAA